jgi:hypothetical protein
MRVSEQKTQISPAKQSECGSEERNPLMQVSKSKTKSSSNCLLKIKDTKYAQGSKDQLDFTKSPINVIDILQAKPQLNTKSGYGAKNYNLANQSGLLGGDDCDKFYALHEDNLKNFVSGDNSLVAFNSLTFQQFQQQQEQDQQMDSRNFRQNAQH